MSLAPKLFENEQPCFHCHAVGREICDLFGISLWEFDSELPQTEVHLDALAN